MKKISLGAGLLACVALGLLAAPVSANNTVVENALKSRPDLSIFYQGLMSTGVLAELKEGQPYTVFAPTNDAFARISPEKYPCFYSAQCKAQVAQVLRNHIVKGEKHVSDISNGGESFHNGGGTMSLFSIDNQHLVVSQPFKSNYTINGQAIKSENQLLGGVIYQVDGVIVSPHDMVQFVAPDVTVINVARPITGLPPRVPAGSVVSITTDQPVSTTAMPAN